MKFTAFLSVQLHSIKSIQVVVQPSPSSTSKTFSPYETETLSIKQSLPILPFPSAPGNYHSAFHVSEFDCTWYPV